MWSVSYVPLGLVLHVQCFLALLILNSHNVLIFVMLNSCEDPTREGPISSILFSFCFAFFLWVRLSDGMLTRSSFSSAPSLGLGSELGKMMKSVFTRDKQLSSFSVCGTVPFWLASHTQTIQTVGSFQLLCHLCGKQGNLSLLVSNFSSYSAEKGFLCMWR